MWPLTEKQTRTLQSLGLALGGMALFGVVIVVGIQVFWIGQPLTCGDRILPPPEHCLKTSNDDQNIVLKVTKEGNRGERPTFRLRF